jgi:hypothetical protein
VANGFAATTRRTEKWNYSSFLKTYPRLEWETGRNSGETRSSFYRPHRNTGSHRSNPRRTGETRRPRKVKTALRRPRKKVPRVRRAIETSIDFFIVSVRNPHQEKLSPKYSPGSTSMNLVIDIETSFTVFPDKFQKVLRQAGLYGVFEFRDFFLTI